MALNVSYSGSKYVYVHVGMHVASEEGHRETNPTPVQLIFHDITDWWAQIPPRVDNFSSKCKFQQILYSTTQLSKLLTELYALPCFALLCKTIRPMSTELPRWLSWQSTRSREQSCVRIPPEADNFSF